VLCVEGSVQRVAGSIDVLFVPCDGRLVLGACGLDEAGRLFESSLRRLTGLDSVRETCLAGRVLLDSLGLGLGGSGGGSLAALESGLSSVGSGTGSGRFAFGGGGSTLRLGVLLASLVDGSDGSSSLARSVLLRRGGCLGERGSLLLLFERSLRFRGIRGDELGFGTLGDGGGLGLGGRELGVRTLGTRLGISRAGGRGGSSSCDRGRG